MISGSTPKKSGSQSMAFVKLRSASAPYRVMHQAVKYPSAAGAEVYRAACTLDDTSETGSGRAPE